jgi:hypothetical protein
MLESWRSGSRRSSRFAEGHLFYSAMRHVQHMRTDMDNALLVKLQEAVGDRAGCWQNRTCCSQSGGQSGVEPVPIGGRALPLYTTLTCNDHLKGGGGWGLGREAVGKPGALGGGGPHPTNVGYTL